MLCSSRASIGRTYGIRFSQFGFSVNNSRTFLDLSGMQLKKGLFTFPQLILDFGIVKTSRAFMTLTKKWIFWPENSAPFLAKNVFVHPTTSTSFWQKNTQNNKKLGAMLQIQIIMRIRILKCYLKIQIPPHN